MESVAVITGADRGLGHAMAAGLLEKGWCVFAGRYMPDWPELDTLAERYPQRLHIMPLDVTSVESVRAAAKVVAEAAGHVDLLINNAGINLASSFRALGEAPQDYDNMHRMYDVNALGPLRVVEAFLPLMARGTMKRLCFVSSEAGSINRCERDGWYGYCTSKAALNMAVKILHNRLRPEGYSFRLYHPGWMRSYMRGVKSEVGDLEPEEAAVPALTYFLRDRGGDPHVPTRHDEDRLVLRDWLGREWPW
ncbi:MAG TPA: SDR family oxidoreductase [Chloroflexi bacterium]|jgi:NAD(P)-dependent dehydrogenase (short-subunit alcohol dehydrogenase family)|nr:SDR family oxidoreductase [Chloroflexota bacterium]